MAKRSTLPPAPFPTNHPWYSEGRHPRVNVFQLMPVRSNSPPLEGEVIRANLATYTDPYSELYIHQAVARSRRWLQGVDIQIGEIHAVPYLGPIGGYRPDNFPGDRVFSGKVLNNHADADVVGVMHPQKYGWLAFEDQLPVDHPETVTIADLKAAIGQISVQEAASLNAARRLTASFAINSQMLM